MKQASSLLIGQPGPLRDGLGYLLTSIVHIKQVSYADDIPSVLCRSDEPCPHLVLVIVGTSSSRLEEALKQLRVKWPQARCIVMVDDEHDLQIAQSVGVDKALLKGWRASKLVETIEELHL